MLDTNERQTMKLTRTIWLVLFWLFCRAAVQAGTVESFRWGVNGHCFSQEAYWHVPIATQLDLVSELGATWYRFDLSFDGFVSNTERMDGLLSGAEHRKLRLLPDLFAEPGARDKKGDGGADPQSGVHLCAASG